MHKILDIIESVCYYRGMVNRKELHAMQSKVITTKQTKDLIRQFKDMGYTVEVTENKPYKPLYIVTGSQGEVFRAMPNAVGNTYLVRYEKGLIQ